MVDQSVEEKVKQTTVFPVLPLRNTLLFPEMIIPLAVGRERSLKAVEQATRGEGFLLILSQKDGDVEEPAAEDLYSVGVIAKILRLMRVAPNNLSVIVSGQSKVRVEEFTSTDPFFEARVGFLEDQPGESLEVEALQKTILAQYEKLAGIVPSIPQEMVAALQRYDQPNRVVDTIAFNLNISLAEKQAILEETSVIQRLKMLTGVLARELQVVELGSKIQSEVIDKMNKAQRDYFLKEQMKAIQKELGEGDDRGREIEELKARVAKAKMPKEVEPVALKEVERLAMMHPSAAEYTVSRTYLDWLIELPWSKSTKDRLDVKRAQRCLDEDHYGLQKVKDRIVEYLAVQQLKKDMKGPILCLVGPPGVGKTSLGRSVARSLGRKFVRMSLGGIRDEAEIRGHRRTYVGALPGRIIQGMRKAGTHNPVFMLDELDKVGMDFRGDPTSALLEVLDPEQNFSFSDHYLEVPFDLSKVMFIATANILDTISQPLLDRTEVIRLPGYTEEEKLHIAKDHLLPRVLDNHGLKRSQIRFEDGAIRKIITEYTREAGVRNLERQMATVCRKVAKERVSGRRKSVAITAETLKTYLGPQQVYLETRERIDRPGVATGLAWTPVGGDILFIESTAMRGRGTLTLTGQLGDVMKESAVAALSWIRSQAGALKVPESRFSKQDIHVHVPQGAIPKDGPSAGVALAASMVSLLTGRVVRDDLAMTGEITLTGKVLPVGGIKEKVLAAKRAGLSEVILPERNANDLDDLTEEAKEGMTFHFVREVSEVLARAIRPHGPGRKRPRAKRGASVRPGRK
ncbi:MAG: endopeptidase La [Acidobacteriota bacterium]